MQHSPQPSSKMFLNCKFKYNELRIEQVFGFHLFQHRTVSKPLFTFSINKQRFNYFLSPNSPRCLWNIEKESPPAFPLGSARWSEHKQVKNAREWNYFISTATPVEGAFDSLAARRGVRWVWIIGVLLFPETNYRLRKFRKQKRSNVSEVNEI